MIAKDMAAATGSNGTNFFTTKLGSGLAMTAADLGTDYISGLISPKLNDTTAAKIGQGIGKVGSMVGSGLVASGYALPVGLAVMGAGKLIGGLVKQFGSVKNDNGTTGYIYQLDNTNPSGTNEQIINSRIGYGPQATYSDGIFTDSGKNWARRQNNKVLQAYENYQRKIRNALTNNNWM